MSRKKVDLDQAIAMYRDDHDLREIGLAQGTSPQTIGRRLQAAGIRLRGKAKTDRHRARSRQAMLRDLDEARLSEMRLDGASCAEIAAELGCSDECVRERMVALGIDRLPAKARMEHNTFWRGGRTVDRTGYILVKSPDHPHCNTGGYVREHRLVMEKTIGRHLRPREVVDHIDGNPGNNHPDNLRLFASNADHLRATLTGKCPQWSAQGEANILDGLRRGRAKLAASRQASGTDARD